LSREITGLAESTEKERGDDIGPFEQVGMIADFPELHDEVHQVLRAEGVGEIICLRDEVGDGDALSKGLVDISLPLTQIDQYINLNLTQMSKADFDR